MLGRLLAALGALCVLAAHPPNQGELKLQELRDKALSSYYWGNSGIISMSAEEYKTFVTSGPRPYNVVVMLSASPQTCPVCKDFEESVAHVSRSYAQLETQDTFFVIVNVVSTEGKGLRELHELRHVPLLAFTRPTGSFTAKSEKKIAFKPGTTYQIGSSYASDSSKILDWVNSHTSLRNVRLHYTMVERLMKLLMLLGIASMLLIVAYAVSDIVRTWPWVPACGALFIQAVSTSGLFYNILQGWQWYGVDQRGTHFIMSSQRGQYVGEGLMASGLVSSFGISLIAACWCMATTKVTPHQRQIALLACVVWAFLAYRGVIGMYTAKVGWYRAPGVLPPGNFKTGWMVTSDQGNSF